MRLVQSVDNPAHGAASGNQDRCVLSLRAPCRSERHRRGGAARRPAHRGVFRRLGRSAHRCGCGRRQARIDSPALEDVAGSVCGRDPRRLRSRALPPPRIRRATGAGRLDAHSADVSRRHSRRDGPHRGSPPLLRIEQHPRVAAEDDDGGCEAGADQYSGG